MAGNGFGCFFYFFRWTPTTASWLAPPPTPPSASGTGAPGSCWVKIQLNISHIYFLKKILDTLYHHRASVWVLRLEGGLAFTGSMDGTVAIVEVEEGRRRGRRVVRHFVAHESEWGGGKFGEA